MEAVLLIFHVNKINTKIEIHKRINSMKASNGCFNVKNSRLHKIFRIKLMPKNDRTKDFFLFLLTNIRYNEIAIRIKRVVQAIGKTKFGGVIAGLIDSYHELLVVVPVNKLPIRATRNMIMNEIIRTFQFIFIIF